jgi:molybdopterin molybdotransferase
MLSVAEARERVLGAVTPLEVVELPVADALGYGLAEDVFAPHDLPRFANSAMDGYAVRAQDTDPAPVELELAGEVRAGTAGAVAVGPGTAVRIMTGAPLPPGADAVVELEVTEEHGGRVLVHEPVTPGRHVRPAGDDLRQGDPAVAAGAELGPGELALLAALGRSPVRVHRRPRVALLVTGDELVDPEAEAGPGQVRDSNTVALKGLVAESGGEVVFARRVGDSLEDTVDALSAAAAAADLMVSSGGVAVGRYDFVKEAVERLGRIDLWRVAMQPGKPVVLGEVGGTPLLALPGNPVSIHVGFEQFVRPALRKMRGLAELLRPEVRARLTRSLDKRPGRLHFVRVRLELGPEGFLATPTGPQGSHIQSSLVGCHGLARFDAALTRLDPGAEVTVEVWRLPGGP